MLMPADYRMYSRRSFVNRAIWYKEFVWWPRRCWISNRWIWLTQAYQGVAIWTGPGTPMFEYHWVDRDQYLMEKIKGTL